MPYIQCQHTNENIRLYYEDLGAGTPVVFIHGWPVTHAMWEYQDTPLREAGFRCITYDRRGFGASDASLDTYDYNALADDLKCLLDALDLRDVTLVGFSMGGGEVVRYCSRYACAQVSKIILVSAVVPFMLKTHDNPDGVPKEMFRQFDEAIRNDRQAFLQDFFKQFFGLSWVKHPVSQGTLDYSFSLAAVASPKATLECMKAFSQTDFRNELSSIQVPALVIHGDADKTVPIKCTSEETVRQLPHSFYKVYAGAPHGLYITHKEALNHDIITFVNTGTIISIADVNDAIGKVHLNPVGPGK
ncbi:MAG TPA: alpha/beta hydrolase [Chitinophagaceae bacterium]|nr:alpha/beta hydrolase [Chitinophagaceae bacterium]